MCVNRSVSLRDAVSKVTRREEHQIASSVSFHINICSYHMFCHSFFLLTLNKGAMNQKTFYMKQLSKWLHIALNEIYTAQCTFVHSMISLIHQPR